MLGHIKYKKAQILGLRNRVYSVIAMLLIYPAPLLAVHDGIGSDKCLRCHDKIPFTGVKSKIIPDYVEVCIECHSEYHGSDGLLHPLGMVPRYPLPKDMPLGQNGEVTCMTCHIFHPRDSLYVGDRATFLRRSSPKRLCMAYHGARSIKRTTKITPSVMFNKNNY